MLKDFDFVALGCVATLSPIIIELIQNLWKDVMSKREQKILACVVTGIVSVLVLFCKAVFLETPTFNIQYWTTCVLFIIFSTVGSQVTYDKLISVIEKLIIKKR